MFNLKNYTKVKNIKSKRLAWIQKSDQSRKKKSLFAIGTMVLLFFFTVSIGMVNEGSASWKDVGKIGAPVAVATIMGPIGSIDNGTNAEGMGKSVKNKMWLLGVDQVDETSTFPVRSGIELGNIPVKAGEYWHYIKSVIDTPEAKSTGNDGDNASTITNELTFVVRGISTKLQKLLENGIGEYFYVVWEQCNTGAKYIGGTGCKPMKLLSFEGGALKDYTGFTITFKNECGQLYSQYVGNTPAQAPVTVAADSASITLTSSETYQVTDGSAAVVSILGFGSVTDADVGRIVTVLGTASEATYPPKFISSTGCILVADEDMSLGLGNQISFKFYKNGASSYIAIEVPGSRI